MRRTIRLQVRSLRALSADFLRAMMWQWLFPTPMPQKAARPHPTQSFKALGENFTPRDRESLFAPQRCVATSLS
jgi:hypothetical protein